MFAVIAFHFGIPYTDGGFVGVDVFFVISGFVIFRSIVREWDETGTFSWQNFTMRTTKNCLDLLFHNSLKFESFY